MAPSNNRPEGMRFCGGCGTTKPLSEFFRNIKSKPRCRSCTNTYNRSRYYTSKQRVRVTQRRYERRLQERARSGDKAVHAQMLLSSCRTRARRLGLPCTITVADIPIPDRCPILDIALAMNRVTMRDNSATIDRIVPSHGYVPGNVIVVSCRANVIKNNATVDEIFRVAAFYAAITTKEVA